MSEKKPILFYWEPAVDAWCPASITPEHIGLSLESMEPGVPVLISFRRDDMTDEEFESMPEA